MNKKNATRKPMIVCTIDGTIEYILFSDHLMQITMMRLY